VGVGAWEGGIVALGVGVGVGLIVLVGVSEGVGVSVEVPVAVALGSKVAVSVGAPVGVVTRFEDGRQPTRNRATKITAQGVLMEENCNMRDIYTHHLLMKSRSNGRTRWCKLASRRFQPVDAQPAAIEIAA